MTSAATIEVPAQSERVQVELEFNGAERRVKIRTERHDRHLGWYTSASLSLPLRELPLLEQAIRRMHGSDAAGENQPIGEIIAFPGSPGEANSAPTLVSRSRPS